MIKNEISETAMPSTQPQFKNIKSAEARQLFLQSLLEGKEAEIWPKIAFQDKKDETGTNLTQIYHELRNNSGLYRSLPSYNNLCEYLSLTLRDRELDILSDTFEQFTFDQFDFPQLLLAGSVITDKYNGVAVISSIELEKRCFMQKNFFAKLTGKGSSSNERANYWIKTGPLLYALEMKGKMSFDLSLSYLDYSQKTRTHLFGLKQKRYPNDGLLSNLFIPLDFETLGSATQISMKGVVKTIQNSNIRQVSLVLRKLLLLIGDDISDPESHLIKLKDAISDYNLACETFRELNGSKAGKHRIPSAFFEPEYRKESEVAYKILDILRIERGISDHQLKKIFYDYCKEEKITALDSLLFIRKMYHATIRKNCFALYTWFMERDLQEYLEMAWLDYRIFKQKSSYVEVLLKDDMLEAAYKTSGERPTEEKGKEKGEYAAKFLKKRCVVSYMEYKGRKKEISEEAEIFSSQTRLSAGTSSSSFFEIHISDFENLCDFLDVQNACSILPAGFSFAYNNRFDDLMLLMNSRPAPGHAYAESFEYYRKIHAELQRISHYTPRISSSLAYRDLSLADSSKVYSSSSSSSSSSSLTSKISLTPFDWKGEMVIAPEMFIQSSDVESVGFKTWGRGFYKGESVFIKQFNHHSELSITELSGEAESEAKSEANQFKHETELLFLAGQATDRAVPLKAVCINRHGADPGPMISGMGFGFFNSLKTYYSYLIMEHIRFKSLSQYLENKKSPLTEAECYGIALDVAIGLAGIHLYKICHGDLKSLNIMLEANLRARLVDFGNAGREGRDEHPEIGTLGWLPPEQCPSIAGDIYSFGVVLWELFTRKQPPCVGGITDKIPEDCPEKPRTIILSCCAKNPDQRPKASALVEEFRLLRKQAQLKETEDKSLKHALTTPTPFSPLPFWARSSSCSSSSSSSSSSHTSSTGSSSKR